MLLLRLANNHHQLYLCIRVTPLYVEDTEHHLELEQKLKQLLVVSPLREWA